MGVLAFLERLHVQIVAGRAAGVMFQVVCSNRPEHLRNADLATLQFKSVQLTLLHNFGLKVHTFHQPPFYETAHLVPLDVDPKKVYNVDPKPLYTVDPKGLHIGHECLHNVKSANAPLKISSLAFGWSKSVVKKIMPKRQFSKLLVNSCDTLCIIQYVVHSYANLGTWVLQSSQHQDNSAQLIVEIFIAVRVLSLNCCHGSQSNRRIRSKGARYLWRLLTSSNRHDHW